MAFAGASQKPLRLHECFPLDFVFLSDIYPETETTVVVVSELLDGF